MIPDREWIAQRIEQTDGCWLWTRGHTPSGYGTASWKEDGVVKGMAAHRLAYRVFVGELDPANHVHHACSNRACVNPEHLVQLSPRDHAREHAFMADPSLRAAIEEAERTGWMPSAIPGLPPYYVGKKVPS